jgi:hypothetical protein
MRKLYRLLIILLLVSVLAACEEEPVPLPTRIPTLTPTTEPTLTPIPPTNTPTPLPTNTPPVIPQTQANSVEEQSYLQIIHTIQSSPLVNVYVESLLFAFELDYGLFTAPTPITTGTYTIRVIVEERATNNSDPEPIIEQEVSVTSGTTLLLLLGGTVDEPVLNVYEEDQTALYSNESRITFIHAAANAPEFNLRGNGTELGVPVGFGNITGSIVLPSQPITFAIYSGEQELISYPLILKEHHHYTFIAVADNDSPSEYAIKEISTRVPGFATLRVVNASESLAVDFYANGELLADNLDPTRTSERLQLPTGLYTVAVYPAGGDYQPATAITQIEFNLNIGDNISLVSMSDANDWHMTRLEDDLSPVAPEQARITFIHTLNSPPLLRVIEGETRVPSISDLPPHRASDSTVVDAGLHNFHWRIVGIDGALGDSAEAAMNVDLAEGRNYLYLMTGRDDGSPPIILSEFVSIDESLLIADIEPLPPVEEPAYIRLVNVLTNEATLDYLLDGISVATSLSHGQPTSPIIITEGLHAISLRIPGGDLYDLVILDYEFIAGTEYTIYAYGTDAEFSELLVIRNLDMGENNPAAHVRFINTTPFAGTRFDLAYTNSGQDIFVPTPDLNANPSVEGSTSSGAIPYREPLFASVVPLATGMGRGESSQPVRLESQSADFYVIDSAIDMVAASIIDYPIEAGIHYDIFAYQEVSSTQVHALIIPYTQP